MPEAETILGRLLNRILGPDEEGVVRSQQIDGAKLPEYQVVRRYLGPAGLYVRSVENGWLVCGMVISKGQAYDAQFERQAVSTASRIDPCPRTGDYLFVAGVVGLQGENAKIARGQRVRPMAFPHVLMSNAGPPAQSGSAPGDMVHTRVAGGPAAAGPLDTCGTRNRGLVPPYLPTTLPPHLLTSPVPGTPVWPRKGAADRHACGRLPA